MNLMNMGDLKYHLAMTKVERDTSMSMSITEASW